MKHSTTQLSASPSSKALQSRRFWWRLAILLFGGLLLIPPLRVGIAGYQTYRTLRQLAFTLRAIEHPASLPSAQPLVKRLRTDLAQLHNSVELLMPVLQHLTFVPRYGPLLATMDDLVAAGEHAAAIVDKGLGLIQSATFVQEDNTATAWVEVGPIIAPIYDDLIELEREVAALPLSQSEGQIGEQLSDLHGAIELATIATQLGAIWPDLLGNARPATYLVLVQNNHELRATGGFISALAPVTFVQGRLQPVEFVDSYAIFSRELAYPPAPPAMRTYMGIELLTLRDANWSPHLPSAATLIRTFYQQHTGLAVDGVITVDLDAVTLLLPAFEYLTLPDSTTAITQENVEDALVQLWNNPIASVDVTSPSGQGDWWAQRKDFIGQLAAAAFGRLQQRSFSPLSLAGGLAKALDRRAVQVWLFDPEAQPPLIERGWDGGLHPKRSADFLAVVDTNLGYNKANAVVTRELEYRIAWPDEPTLGAEATLTLTYTHPVNRTDPVCRAVSYYGARYEDMIARCYFNYSRVFVPAGSELLSAEGWLDATVSSERAEQGTQQFAGYFVLNPGSRHQVTLRYRLPPSLHPEGYQLVLQRQSGTDPLPVHLHSTPFVFEETLVNGQLVWTPEQ